ncbi:hypothetical protein Y1Q_0020443 [Alligator mississippiensis]|uniref:Uncharacterized protein n=1 Tax=Alligator mississippiensis TaxID=8496 RepID=A0A151N6U4_ALLMI|nr:hypothetical protein Y1Q_0020443 [Alligator mississippiensis]
MLTLVQKNLVPMLHRTGERLVHEGLSQDYKSDIMPLTSSAKNSPQGPVSRDILLNRLDSVTAFAFFSVLLQPSITGSDFT